MKKKQFIYGVLSFVIPVVIMAFLYWRWKIYPGSYRTLISGDGITQFANFYDSFHDVLTRKESGLYSFHAGTGLNYYAFISYYLGGFLTPLVFFFSKAAMPTAYYFLTLLKIGLAGLAFWVYAKETFKVKPVMNIALSTAYSLMSFIVVHSEVIIWLDAFIYFPLIMLGIDRLLEKRKPKCLFFSYLALFLTNYYFAFMIGIFSFLYFLVRYFSNLKEFKARLVPYFTTSILAGLSSMVMILPMFLDLRQNGQPLDAINHVFVKEAGLWDFFAKNFIGVYDTTKYETIPFIYIGLVPLIFALYFFYTKKVSRRDKIGYGLLGGFIIASFFIWPLALLWQGFHSPIMFHFRFSFVMSFFIIMLAGRAMPLVDKAEVPKLCHICIALIALFGLSMLLKPEGKYYWITAQNMAMTILVILVYLGFFYYASKEPKTTRWLRLLGKYSAVILSVLMIGETFVNTHFVLNKMHQEWPYLMKSTYQRNSKSIQTLVDYANEHDGKDFYHFESLLGSGRPNNDSFRYGYSGIHMFSSVRNCNVSAVLNGLGFRNAQDDGLTVDYMNNTLIMDSLFGVRWNIAETNPEKFGFSKAKKAGDLQLYENKYALPAGIVANGNVTKFKMDYNNPLVGQKNFIKALTGKDYNLFTTVTPELIEVDNTPTPAKNKNYIESPANYSNTPRYYVYEVKIPAGMQAYFELLPKNDVYTDFEFTTWATVTSPKYDNGHKQIRSLGSFYNLGVYQEDETIKFVVKIDGRNNLVMKKPKVVLLNLDVYKEIMQDLQDQGVQFQMHKRFATAQVNFDKAENIFTTIPYDKGWTLKIDGHKQKIKTVNDGFIQIHVPKGKHKIELSYFPPGLKIGMILFVSCLIIFGIFDFWYERRKVK